MEMVIGISYNIMSESKRNLSRARDDSQEENIKLNNARSSLENSGSSRLRMSEDAISDQIRNVIKRMDNIDKITAGIDYAVRRFQEVDEACASRIKATGLEFRGVAGLLNKKEKFRADPIGSMMSDGKKIWKVAYEGVSDAWVKHGELITNIAICALEATAVVVALPAIIAMSAVGATALAVVAALAATYSANTFIDSGAKVIQELQGKTDTGFNIIQSGFQLLTGDKKKGEDIYNITAIGVSIFTLGVGGVLSAISKVKNIKAASAVGSLVKTEPLLKDANKVIKLTAKYSNLAKQNNARIIDHANKVVGVGGKETRAFRQAEQSYNASIKYNHMQEGIAKNSGIITENLKSAFLGGTSTVIEKTVPKGTESFDNLINGTSKSTVFNPYLTTVRGFSN